MFAVISKRNDMEHSTSHGFNRKHVSFDGNLLMETDPRRGKFDPQFTTSYYYFLSKDKKCILTLVCTSNPMKKFKAFFNKAVH